MDHHSRRLKSSLAPRSIIEMKEGDSLFSGNNTKISRKRSDRKVIETSPRGACGRRFCADLPPATAEGLAVADPGRAMGLAGLAMAPPGRAMAAPGLAVEDDPIGVDGPPDPSDVLMSGSIRFQILPTWFTRPARSVRLISLASGG
jgi:hypothetical protein